jgi:Xaa-Pro aminopeptidase
MPNSSFPAHRIERLRALLADAGLDAIAIADRSNTRYLSEFVCSASLMVIDAKHCHFITDPRYGEAAESELGEHCQVHVFKAAEAEDGARRLFKKAGYEKVGFEGSITVNEYESLKKRFAKAKLKEAGALVMSLRRVKDEAEIKTIRKAVRLADKVMTEAVDRLKVGMSEQGLSRVIRFQMEELGGERESFSNIVASGPNSSRPHHHPTSRKFRKGDPVTIDLGGVVDGYCSDLTRTPVIGKPTAEFEQIYEVTLRAQQAAIAAIKPGMTGEEVDAIARDIIADAGFGGYFGHGLGHGVGLDIHEEPRLRPGAKDYKLEPGNIVTVEPGIYIPGEHGLRIEDYVLVTETGAEVLSKSTRRLQVVG